MANTSMVGVEEGRRERPSPVSRARKVLGRLLRRGGRSEPSATVLTALNSVPQGFCIYDAGDRLVFANEGFGHIYGPDVAGLPSGTPFLDIIAHSVARGNYPGRDADEIWAERKAFVDQRQPGTFLQTLGDGRLIAITHQPLADGGWAAVYEDITERRRLEARLSFMAHHDPLTGLANRLEFDGRLAAALAACSTDNPVALLCLDLDGFKPVNDVWGHGVGDQVLRQVADRLREGLRPLDLAARLGGDEFAILLPGVGRDIACQVANRLRVSLSRPYLLGDAVTVTIGASVGVSLAPSVAATPDAVLAAADEALYRAKRSGQAGHARRPARRSRS